MVGASRTMATFLLSTTDPGVLAHNGGLTYTADNKVGSDFVYRHSLIRLIAVSLLVLCMASTGIL